ncbi:endonuclease V [Elusimicrobiota bacterium]
MPNLHNWDLDPKEAAKEQRRLRGLLSDKPPKGRIGFVAGCDAIPSPDEKTIFAAAIVFKLPKLEEVERASAELPLTFPYIPGLLSFREGPALIAALEKLKLRPDAVLFDGQGIAHPKRLGLACHVGLWLDLPTVGCAKSCLVGDYNTPRQKPGALSHLVHEGKHVGAALRTKTDAKPIFVSPGHMMDLKTAIHLTQRCCVGQRLPKPTLEADRWTRAWKRELKSPGPSRSTAAGAGPSPQQ